MKTSWWQWLASLLAAVALAFVVTVVALFGASISTGILATAVMPLGWAALGLGATGLAIAIGVFVKERRG